MPFQIHYTKDFKGTDYIEVGPGTYDGKHWQPDFVFISEEDFWIAEGIVHRHFSDYEHYGMNSIPEAAAQSIVSEWRNAALALEANSDVASELLGKIIFQYDRAEISRFLKELADICDGFIVSKSSFCILGL